MQMSRRRSVMTIWDLQKMDGQKIKETIEKMSKAEIKEVIDSCGTIQGKIAIKRNWENLTGKKYRE